MCDFDHPHVLGLVGICLDDSNSPYLILPYMENGDLKNYLKSKRENVFDTLMCSEVCTICWLDMLVANSLVQAERNA